MASLAVREQARLICERYGFKAGAHITGQKYMTLAKWAERFQWKGVPKYDDALDVSTLSNTRDRHREVSEALSESTRLYAAITTHKALSASAGRKGIDLLERDTSIAVRNHVQSADVTHGWSDARQVAPVVQVATVVIPSESEVMERRKAHADLDAVARLLSGDA